MNPNDGQNFKSDEYIKETAASFYQLMGIKKQGSIVSPLIEVDILVEVIKFSMRTHDVCSWRKKV